MSSYSADVRLSFIDPDGKVFGLSHLGPDSIRFSGAYPTWARGTVRMEIDGEPQEWPVRFDGPIRDGSVLILGG